MSTTSNFISEWYGVRLFPSVSCSSDAIRLFQQKRCPFLSDALETPTACIKSPNSAGVCTVSTTKSGIRDWIVCPYRALERPVIHQVTRKIFSDNRQEIPVFPVVHLQDESRRNYILERASKETIYIFFQDKLGGELNVTGSSTTPEISFDVTIIECNAKHDWLLLKRYGILEIQTMDFHGSYRHAVRALEAAVDLHVDEFGKQVENNQTWLGRKIEGPNIANVFKRTIYQLILKFGLSGQDRCAGVVLGLPESVWESWAPHFAGLEWTDDKRRSAPTRNSWIFVLAPEQVPISIHSRIEVLKQIQVTAETLVHRAFSVVPMTMVKDKLPGLFETMIRRTRRFYQQARPDHE